MSISFQIELVTDQGRIHGLDMGHVTVRIGASSVSSKTLGQPMMLFLSLALLLDGVRRVASRGGVFRFVGVDCSFELVLKATGKTAIAFEHRKLPLGEASRDEVVAALWSEVQRFVGEHQGRFDRDDSSSIAAFDDLAAAMADFAKVVSSSGGRAPRR
jgi:hypothetical protein